MYTVTINGKKHELDADGTMPLLWALRDLVGLTGTKFGCGVAQCGACTVHLEGAPVRACVVPLASVNGKSVVTIEGLSADGSHPVQRAWTEANVPQCGYCQAGQIMSAAALLARTSAPSDQDIDTAMAGNLCRCGTYYRIRKAVRRAAELQAGAQPARAAGQGAGQGAAQGAGHGADQPGSQGGGTTR